ncbi:AP-1 complex subunit sigma-2 [Astathelohania contejeani]|uniref:AP complex subunit sigma n=1 Tax=Astathelohania contejeani TaxID=164912 RepID=A0ABQ7HWL1_9MICR|nr:AP-1 complex subunit sigma-2 [Thelohania contejeani]
MILGVLAFNANGIMRISRIYHPISKEEIIKKILGVKTSYHNIILTKEYTIVYEKYAGLFISFVVRDENELGVLDLINRFVIVLDKYFGRACELNLVYNFDAVLNLLDEFILGGVCIELDPNKVVELVCYEEMKDKQSLINKL